jgi:transcriptional regulator with XRE-family HTH domain
MRLQEFMASRCLTDAEMAELVGCPVESLRRLRGGYSRPSLERAYRIEQVTRGEVGLADWQYPFRYPRRKKAPRDARSARSSEKPAPARG